MSQYSAVFFDSNAASLPVLFTEARAWAERELSMLEQVEVEDITSVSSENALLFGDICPEITAEQYRKLMEIHSAVGADITVFTVKNTAGGIERNADAEICSLLGGSGPVVLPVLCMRSELVKGKEISDPISFADDLIRSGASAEAVEIEPVCVVKDPAAAFAAQKQLCKRINFGHIANGVQIFDPENVYISPDAMIGSGTVILPGTIVRENCVIGSGCTIGPNTILEKASVGDRTSVNSSQIYESSVGTDATVGPFAYIRPGCTVGDHTRIGDFVELKKSVIGNGTKVSHLTYIGDAEVGERVNFGCGTVVVNYDGYHKNKTIIGDDCFIGCNTNLVSPIELGDRVFTAAGSTVTDPVPDGALTIARARQTNIEGWNDRRREAMGKK